MNWTNFHTHSHFCDGKESPAAYKSEAIKKKMLALGFSGHAPVPFPAVWCIKPEKLNEYCTEINRLKSENTNLQIYLGLEIDYIENVTGVSYFKKLQLDYSIGSVHFFKKKYEDSYLNFDLNVEQFRNCLNQIFDGNIQAMVNTYFENLIKMVETDTPDIVGHFDIITKFNKNHEFFHPNQDWFKRIVLDALQIIRKKDIIIEVNTRGKLRNYTNNFYPDYWILQQIQKMSIPIMINADAHSPVEVDSFFTEAAEMLIELNFKTLRVLYDKQWKDIPFSAGGLEIS